MKQNSHYILSSILMLILVILLIMISVAFFTLFERKIMGMFHYRKGPNKVGMLGLFQPFSDALKLLSKQFFYPFFSNNIYYMMAPMFMLIMSLIIWMIYPFFSNLSNFKMNMLFFLCVMSMGVYPLFMMGWASNSSFPMIGAIRAIAQSISYEVTFAISLLIILNLINSLSLNYCILYSKYIQLFMLFYPLLIILLLSMLAEINRTPFDLTEGESELVSGFNVEYGASKFTLIFLSEYSSIMFMMFLFTMIFFYSTHIYMFMFIFNIFCITWIRMTFPRIRYDNLMQMCWFYLLPMTLLNYLMFFLFIKFPLDSFMMN